MAEPIEIIIRKGTGGDATGFGIPGATPGGPSEAALKRGAGFGKEMESLPKQSGDKILAVAAATSMASLKKALNYAISQYGNQTGNYIEQAEIQAGLSFFTQAFGMGMGAGITAAMYGTGAGVAVLAGAVVSTGVNYGFQIRDLRREIAKLDTYNNTMRERSGGTFSNGSRGTDY